MPQIQNRKPWQKKSKGKSKKPKKTSDVFKGFSDSPGAEHAVGEDAQREPAQGSAEAMSARQASLGNPFQPPALADHGSQSSGKLRHWQGAAQQLLTSLSEDSVLGPSSAQDWTCARREASIGPQGGSSFTLQSGQRMTQIELSDWDEAPAEPAKPRSPKEKGQQRQTRRSSRHRAPFCHYSPSEADIGESQGQRGRSRSRESNRASASHITHKKKKGKDKATTKKSADNSPDGQLSPKAWKKVIEDHVQLLEGTLPAAETEVDRLAELQKSLEQNLAQTRLDLSRQKRHVRVVKAGIRHFGAQARSLANPPSQQAIASTEDDPGAMKQDDREPHPEERV